MSQGDSIHDAPPIFAKTLASYGKKRFQERACLGEVCFRRGGDGASSVPVVKPRSSSAKPTLLYSTFSFWAGLPQATLLLCWLPPPPGFEMRVSAGEGEAGGGVNSFHLLGVPDIAAQQWVLSSWFQPRYSLSVPGTSLLRTPRGHGPSLAGPPLRGLSPAF